MLSDLTEISGRAMPVNDLQSEGIMFVFVEQCDASRENVHPSGIDSKYYMTSFKF